MEVRSFNCELGISNLLFKRLFSNIKIERTDAKGKKKDVVVNCQFGQRSRIFKNWQNSDKKATIKLPMIIINRTGYSRDPARLSNLHNEVKYEITKRNRIYDLMQPVPVSISYEVTVLSKWQSDIDQIASNFMVFFNSSLFVSCIHPKFDGIKMNNQVIMEDSVAEEHPDELDGSSDDFVTSTFNFTFKTFLFAGMKQAKKIQSQILSTYISSFISSAVYEFKDDAEVSAYLQTSPHAKLSTMMSAAVTAEVTSYVDNPEVSDLVYDDFTPIINQIDVGFYPVPMVSSITEHMQIVDSQYTEEYSNISGYISSTSYISGVVEYEDEQHRIQSCLTSLTPADMIYDVVDSDSTIYPYVDRIIWRIDAASPNQFPDNIYTYRKNQS